jgi:hypothetical protein
METTEKEVSLALELTDTRKLRDDAYRERNMVVAGLAAAILNLRGGRAWLGRHEANNDEWVPEWRTVVYVRLPTGGQLSWHIHDSEVSDFAFLFGNKAVEPYDGHTTAQKYARLAQWIEDK